MNAKGEWRLSPAYDLTFSSGPQGEQSTMVKGEGRNPGIKHLLRLGQEAKLPPTLLQEIIQQTQAALAEWEILAKTYGVLKSNIALIGGYLNRK